MATTDDGNGRRDGKPLFPGIGHEAMTLPFVLPWQMLQAASKTVQLAPDALQQSINSGWSFGNVNVNSNNSSAPATELAIVSRESYGRQLGRLMDAVEVLVQRLPAAPARDSEDRSEAAERQRREQQALADFAATCKRVRDAKDEVRHLRAERMSADLRWLSEHDRPAYDALKDKLRKLLAELP